MKPVTRAQSPQHMEIQGIKDGSSVTLLFPNGRRIVVEYDATVSITVVDNEALPQIIEIYDEDGEVIASIPAKVTRR